MCIAAVCIWPLRSQDRYYNVPRPVGNRLHLKTMIVTYHHYNSGRAMTTEDAISSQCPSCKVSVVSRQNYCPYCGAYFDSSHRRRSTGSGSGMRRSASAAHLPALNSQGGSVFSDMLMSNLGRVTLGPIGIDFDSDRLPYLINTESRNTRLVLHGSGNTSPNLLQLGSGHEKCRKKVPKYMTETRLSRSEISKMISAAKKSKEWSAVEEFYALTFSNCAHICATFKKDMEQNGAKMEDPDLKVELLNYVMDKVESLGPSVQKSMLKSIVTCLLDVESNTVLYAKDYPRALFILLQNPIFSSQSTYSIFAHLLQQLTSLSNIEHQYLVHWFRTLSQARLRGILRNLLQFVTIRQFPPADKSLPPLNKSRWWIPTATKVLALLNAANNLNTALLDYTEFYNVSLDHMDLMAEYYAWQNPDRPGQFSYCQYPFILSIVAKRHILTKDSEQQMILTARRSLVQKMARNQAPKIEIFFLNISVRRNNIVSDSLKEISEKQKDLKKKLKVSFVGEPGLDMGGLTKEWFQLLVKQIFEPDYGMFVYHPHSRCYWFSVSGSSSNLREYNLIGVLMGLAVYNSIILDLHFPAICYKKLLTPPVVPANEDAAVGIVANPALEDLAEIMPDVAHSLHEVLDYKGNVAEDLMLTFEVFVGEYGKITSKELLANGGQVPVTNDNRSDFVKLYLDWLLNSSIDERFRAFYLGFHSVCASNALIMLRPEEVEQLVCGCPTLDLVELRKVTFYDGYKPDDKTIQHFWEVTTRDSNLSFGYFFSFKTRCTQSKFFVRLVFVEMAGNSNSIFLQVLADYSEELQKKFLLFTTGSDRVPVGGMGEMTFKITKMVTKSSINGNEAKKHASPVKLPESHTCFNQLVLPGRILIFNPIIFALIYIWPFFTDYKDKETLKKKLTIAISNAEGFGLE